MKIRDEVGVQEFREITRFSYIKPRAQNRKRDYTEFILLRPRAPQSTQNDPQNCAFLVAGFC